MQLFNKGQVGDAPTASAGSVQSSKITSWFSNNKRSIAAVALIVLAALFMRTVFAYAISANSDFALSGGTVASEHLRNVTAMIASGNFFTLDTWMFAPDGSVNVHPPLVDLIVAGIGCLIKTITGMPPEEAAAAALGSTSAIMGALACIPMYYLGKEVFDGSKKAGFLAALFLAFCPVVVTNTVFSNGTTIAFTLFFAICMFYFVVKGVKLIDNDHTQDLSLKSMLEMNRDALKYALIASIFLIIIAYSWNGFRTFVALFLFTMLFIMIVNRFKVRDARPIVAFFTTIIGLGVIVAAPYYIVCGLWDLVFSGVAYMTIIGLVVCISFALLQKKPWVYTIPAYIIAAAALFIALFFAVPDVFNVLVNGNSVYAQEIQSIIGSGTLSFSQVATYFGFITMWCGAIVVIWMVFQLHKKSNSVPFLAAFFGLIFGMILAVNSGAMAVVYSPFFAVAFAACIYWVFEHVNFTEYFKSFRGCNIKTVWRKIVEPKPFVAIICVVLLIGAPNMLTAVDASISNNEKSDWNEGAEDVFHKAFLGSIGYTVYTDDDYKINYTLKQYGKESDDSGTMLTWVDYSADAVTYGHFRSVTDTKGHNAVAMAQILLGDETRGESTAAMIVYSMNVMGFEKGANWLCDNHYISNEAKERILNLNGHVDDYRSYVLRAQDVYGQLDSGISDDNVKYIFLKKYLTDAHGAGKDIGGYNGDDKFVGVSTWNLSKAYAGISKASNSEISSVMVSLGMFPIQFGDGSVFSTIASIAGYKIEKAYGNAPDFYTVNTQTGAYTYTNAMYNTLLYKTIGGKTSEESSQSSDSSIFESVYGLSNFTADYDHFYVEYNSKEDATATSDGWELKTYDEANKLKKEKGGVINYFGYPVVVDVADYSDTAISGTVVREMTSASNADNEVVEDARVELWGEDGKKLATAYTDRNGYYEVPNFGNGTVKIYAGAAKTATTGGTLVFSKKVTEQTTTLGDAVIKFTTLSGYVSFIDKDETVKRVVDTASAAAIGVKVVLTGTNFGKTYEIIGTGDGNSPVKWISEDCRFEFKFNESLVIDTYSIKVTDANGTSLGSGNYTLAMGDNSGYTMQGTVCKETITVVDENSVPIEGKTVTLTNEKNNLQYKFCGTNKLGQTSMDIGEARDMYILPGTYKVTVGDGELVTSGTITVSSATSTNTVTVFRQSVEVSINAGDYNGDKIYVSNGFYTGYAEKADGNGYTIRLPISTIETESAKFTAYAYDGESVYSKAFTVGLNMSPVDLVKTEKANVVKVTGKLLKTSDKDPVASSGIVTFVSDAGVTIIVDAVKYPGSEDYVYTAILPQAGSWSICATDSSAFVYYENTNQVTSKDITMDKAYKVSGKYYWGSSVYFRYVNLKVSGIEGVNDFTVSTDDSGSYSVMVPEDKKCTVTTPSLSGTQYYYLKDDNTTSQDAIHYDFDKDKKTNNFVAYANYDKGKYDETDTTDYCYVIKNSTGYDIYIDGELVKNGEVKKSTSSLTHPYFTVKLNYVLFTDGFYYYCSSLVIPIENIKPVEEGKCPIYEIVDTDLGDFKDYSEKYIQVKTVYEGDDKPTLTITNMRADDVYRVDQFTKFKPFADLQIKTGDSGDDLKYSDDKTVKYITKYLSYVNFDNYKLVQFEDPIGLTCPYLIKVTRTESTGDGTENKIFYQVAAGNEAKDKFDANVLIDLVENSPLKKAVAYTGTTGLSYSGNVVFKWDDGKQAMSTPVTSGTYSISLPASTTYSDVNAVVTTKVNEDTLKYWNHDKGTSVGYTTETGNTAVFNIPVSNTASSIVPVSNTATTGGQDDLHIKIDSITKMDEIKDDTREVKIEFVVYVTYDGSSEKTCLLSGGSAWKSLKFYDKNDNEITSVTLTGTPGNSGTECKLKCVGIFKVNYGIDGKSTTSAIAAADSRDLCVILSDTDNTVLSRGGFMKAGELIQDWKCTKLPVEIGFGTNLYGEGQRLFAVKFVNPNNFPVDVTISLKDIDTTEGITYMVQCGEDVFFVGADSPTKDIRIPGAATTEVKVQKIYRGLAPDSDITSTMNMSFQIGDAEYQGNIGLKLINDDAKDITISDNKRSADVKATINIEKSITPSDHSADGRGVFNSLGTAPAYIMVLTALVLLGVIGMLWLGFRRGVFTRKK